MIKTMRNVLFSLLFTVTMFAAGGTQDNPSPCWQTETVRLAFDDTYTPDGIKLFVIEIQACMPDGTVYDTFDRENYTGLTPKDGKFEISVYNQVANYQNDIVFYFQARVLGEGGKTSEWSNKLWVYKNWQPIVPPEIELKKN